jgi:hypothetical protein
VRTHAPFRGAQPEGPAHIDVRYSLTDMAGDRPATPGTDGWLELQQLRASVEAHKGFAVAKFVQLLDQPLRLLLVPNGRALDEHLSLFPKDEDGAFLFDLRLRDRLDAYLEEALRLVHNLVGAVGTTVEHTRRVVRRAYPDPRHPVRASYDAAIQAFVQDGRLMTVQGLRKFILHRDLPEILARMSVDEDVESATVELSTRSLLEWKEWKPVARSYLGTIGETVELRAFTRHYVGRAIQLQAATMRSIEAEEAHVLREFRALAAEHDALAEQLQARGFAAVEAWRETHPS